VKKTWLIAVLSLMACGVETIQPTKAIAPTNVAEEDLTLQSVPYNRLVQALSLSRDSSGRKVLTVTYGLELADQSTATIDLTADIVVTRTTTSQSTRLELAPAVKHGAIQCVVTCGGECPGLIEDGECYGCKCHYKPIFTIPLPWDPAVGEVISAKLVPSRGGVREIVTTDDIKAITVPAGL
jgi:hypothetical protein